MSKHCADFPLICVSWVMLISFIQTIKGVLKKTCFRKDVDKGDRRASASLPRGYRVHSRHHTQKQESFILMNLKPQTIKALLAPVEEVWFQKLSSESRKLKPWDGGGSHVV